MAVNRTESNKLTLLLGVFFTSPVVRRIENFASKNDNRSTIVEFCFYSYAIRPLHYEFEEHRQF